MKRKASAVWEGGLKDGKGRLSTASGVLSDTQYSFATRFEDGVGTNPEELIAAAHAGCFSMALSGQLGSAGMTAQRIQTAATLTLEKTDAGLTITAVHLDVSARIPGADAAAFATAANNAKAGCPVSRVLNAKITLDARLRNPRDARRARDALAWWRRDPDRGAALGPRRAERRAAGRDLSRARRALGPAGSARSTSGSTRRRCTSSRRCR
jgi:osmotically inducible protein OsmC